jgi:hypothetical protein
MRKGRDTEPVRVERSKEACWHALKNRKHREQSEARRPAGTRSRTENTESRAKQGGLLARAQERKTQRAERSKEACWHALKNGKHRERKRTERERERETGRADWV